MDRHASGRKLAWSTEGWGGWRALVSLRRGGIMLGVCVAVLSVATTPSPARGSPLPSAGKRPTLHPGALLSEYVLEPVGAWGGPISAFEKHGDIGYIGSGQRLGVLDMSDLADIRELGSVRLDGPVIQGDLPPYSSEMFRQMQIHDLSAITPHVFA